jgi:hypothetical protein
LVAGQSILVGLASLPLVGADAKRIALLMTWTLVDDTIDRIHVRAIIDTKTEANEIRDLIAALEKRLTKEESNERTPDV